MANVSMTAPSSTIGIVCIDGVTYRAQAGVFSIPAGNVAQAQSLGLEPVTTRSASAAPTTLDIPAGTQRLWKNTGDGSVKLYYNDGGTLKSVTLV